VRPASLLVICKTPVPGKVKTRLTPPCTPEQAAGLAAAALADTLAAVAAAGGPGRRRILVLDGEPGPWVPDGFEVLAQHGEGLAGRLANAFADAGAPALLVGMDTPQLTAGLLEQGLAALDEGRADAVYGAADDGGYWTIGLAAADARVFDGVPMSVETTGAAQRSRLGDLGYTVEDLPSLLDVDTIADARAVAQLAPASRFAAALTDAEATLGSFA
jgi:uncharacterized protein